VPDRTTRALLIDHFDDLPHLGVIPVPAIGPTGVLIRVRAASVNAFDAKVAAGVLRNAFTYTFPVTIGRDYAGVVTAVGEQVSRVRVGDEVFGYLTETELRRGSFADHVWVDEAECFIRTPAGLDPVIAACLPLAGVVALRCVDAIRPDPDDVVLVVGAPGGVGSYVVQLAAARGAHVIATGHAEDEQYLKDLGAAETVPPGPGVVAAVTRRCPGGVAGLVDLVHYRDAFEAQADVVAPGGRAVSLHRAADDEAMRSRGITATNVGSAPDAALLSRLGDLAADGALRVSVRATYPLDGAAEALSVHTREHTRGKLAITTEPEPT
jgi:NADPH:quinone reductase